MHTATRKILFTVAILGAVASMAGGIIGYRQYVHAMACYADSTCSTDSDGTLTTNTTAIPAGTCASPVGLTVNGVAQSSGTFSGFSYYMMKVKSSGTVIQINKSWVGDNTDQWLLLTCSSAGTPLTYSTIATAIPAGYYLQSIPTIGQGGTCSYPVTNGCTIANASTACFAGYANSPASMFTKKSQTTSPCISGMNYSLCSYGSVTVSPNVNLAGASWTVTGPFDQNPTSYNGLPLSNSALGGSGAGSTWTNARVGSYSIAVTAPAGYTYSVSPSATQSISCAVAQSITFSITFTSTTCGASGICPSTANGGTCSGYTQSSATYATLCSAYATTATCNNGTWSGTVPTYSSCTQYCAISGSCPATASGGTCSGYTASSATNPPNLCSSYATTATCTAGGTWSGTVPSFSYCNQYCGASGVCGTTLSGSTCSGYSISAATYPTLCSANTMSATCQANGSWTSPLPTYGTCTQSCAASGACASATAGSVCTSYASSAPLTTCSAINSTCQSNGQWSVAPGAYGSCSNPCAASGGCPLTTSGGSCTSYSTSTAVGPNTCSTYARTSTCSNGSWSLAPYAYASCGQTCVAGSVTASPSTVTAQSTTALSPPTSWTGGTYTSNNASVLTVSGSTGTGVFAGSATVTGSGWTDPYGATGCALSGAAVTVRGTYTIDPSVSATVGGTAQDHGYYDADGSGTATTTQTVTTGPSWSSSNTAIATISSSGLVTCVSAGTATITSVYQGVTATGSAVCSAAKSCTVSSSPNPIVSGNASSLSWSSTGVAACTWTSGLSGSAGISGSQSVNPANTTSYALNCDSGGATCSTSLGVCPSGTVAASPGTATVGKTVALSAPAGWTGGTYSSSNSGILSVAGSTGTGVATGTATITGSGWTASNGVANCPLSGVAVPVVTCPAGSVTATPSSITAGYTTALSAPAGWTGGTYSSSNSGILSVAGSTGTGVAAGTASVTGANWTASNGATGCSLSGASVTVVTCPAGTVSLSPTSFTAQASTTITQPAGWTGGTFSSSNTSVVTISGSSGTGITAGTSTISGSGWTASNGALNCSISGATATVNGSFTVDPSKGAIVGATVQFNGYYDPDVGGAQPTQTVTSTATWSSSNPTVAQSLGSGQIKCLASGTATITAQYTQPANSVVLTANGTMNCSAAPTCSVVLNPTSVVSGSASSLSWSSAGVAACTWTSGLSGSAGTSGSQSVSPSTSTTYALNCDSGAATCSGALTVIPPCPTGFAVTATPTGIPINGTTTLSAPSGWTGGTFSSSNSGVLSITGTNGRGVASGIATVTGTGWNVNTGAINCPLNGTAVTVSQPTLTINNAVYIGVGKTANLSATYSVDGTPGNNQIVTTQSTWSSNNSGVAASLGNGAFSGVSAGAATITANYAPGSISATGTINIVQCKASDITITLRSGINTPMANIPVTVSTNVGTLTVTSGTTNAQGVFVTSLRGPVPAGVVSSPTVATISATAQSVTLTKTVTFDPASVCYSAQIGLTPANQIFASLGNLFAAVFPYVHPSVLMGMVWGAGKGQ